MLLPETKLESKKKGTNCIYIFLFSLNESLIMYLSVPIEFVTVLFCITFHTKKHNRKKNVEYLYLYSIILRFCLSQILLLKKKECLNVGTVPMFKMRNVGTQIMYNLCFELEFGLYGKKDTMRCVIFFSLESSRQAVFFSANP